MTAAAFFDIDYTITRINSGRRIIGYLYKKDLVNRQFFWEIISAFLLHKLGLMTDSRVVKLGAKFFRGKKKSEIKKIAEESFENMVKEEIYEEMTDIIKQHKKKKHKIIIITNEYDVLAELFRKYINADYILSSELDIKDGEYTGRLKGTPCSGNNKGKKARELAEKLKIDLSKSYAYTDSISDIKLLEEVGNPVAVNPDKRLLRLAGKNNWKIIYPKR